MNEFKRNLAIGFGISLLLLIASSVASYFSINNLLYSAGMVNHTNEVAKKLESVIATLRDAETGQRGYLLTNNPRFLDSYNGSYERVTALIDDVKQLTVDNPPQQRDCEELKSIAQQRILFLTNLVDRKRDGEAVADSLLLIGRTYMNNARNLIKRMQDREQNLLVARTRNMNRFATSTPVFILVASLLAILFTVISFLRVLKDYNKRLELQTALQQKDAEISQRLSVIEGITNEISSGNYRIKIDDEGKDALGGIAYSVNKMAESLDVSFTNLTEREWLQTGVASLNELVILEQDINTLAKGVLNFITEYSGSQAGALYVMNSEGLLELKSSYALSKNYPRKRVPLGEGLVGQAAEAKRTIEVKDVRAHNYILSYISGEVKPASVIAVPFLFNRVVKGVIEMASLGEYSSNTKLFLEAASFNTAIAINTAQSRQRVQELLEETQSQSEELQAQHTELENINSELEAQAEKLQASEEELKVQQEELQQTNQELEERSRLLEEKNEVILERNLQIQAKAEELAISTKYKSEFLANMSHELRTPLNSILLLSRLLSENHEQNLSSEQIEYANVIQSSGTGLLTLIDEILDLSKIEAGKMELEYNDVNLSAFTDELQSLFSPIAKDKGIGFSISVFEGVPGSIETDRLRLEQILRNLISNALKFTKKGMVQLKIGKLNGSITFSVKDTGIGIAKEKQQTIFEAFQQADGSTRRQFGGTGLGLSISRELAKLLGGEIKLESEEGKGSEFILVLPEKRGNKIKTIEKVQIEPLEHAPLAIPDNGLDSSTERFISEIIPSPVDDDRQNIQPGDKTILIVEDDTAFARSLLEYARQKGYKGLVAVRGDEAVGLARHFHPMG
ncbi:MAG TPA: CHASE3 domain-containing protein, partial [Flavitalea sp.]|nr:CHASE3 domain-containing protein [Flavitalea sp.]